MMCYRATCSVYFYYSREKRKRQMKQKKNFTRVTTRGQESKGKEWPQRLQALVKVRAEVNRWSGKKKEEGFSFAIVWIDGSG